MKPSHYLHLISGLVLIVSLGACASLPPLPSTQKAQQQLARVSSAPDPLPKPEVKPKPEPEPLRHPETVKRYPVGPYIDPHHPEIRHERHWIARVEQSADWNLQPADTKAQTVAGPMAITDPAAQPNPILSELARELSKQREASAILLEQSQAMTQRLEAVTQQSELTRQLAERQEQLGTELSQTRAALETLQKEVTQLQTPPAEPQASGWLW